jgi:23S rRNA (adenine2503-C2)-methyltransferase
MSSSPLIYDLSLEELRSTIEGWGEPAYRTTQIWHALYQRLVPTPSEMLELPSALRQRLQETFRFAAPSPSQHLRSRDGTTEKVLLPLDGGQSVEAVLMHYDRRRTACVSTQVGCAMGCSFCATGQMDLQRNLSAGEIVLQVLHFARQLLQDDLKLDNVVVMGMGEPFHNYPALADALRRLNHTDGFRFGARRITVSTVGLIPGIEQFGREFPQVNLAISLHAATNELRNQLIPANKRYPLEALMRTCRSHVALTGRRVTFEWALIREINDGVDQARYLATLVDGLNCHINLIPLNPTTQFPGKPSSKARIAAFTDVLDRHGIPNSVRVRRGLDIDAGCGQLAIRNS